MTLSLLKSYLENSFWCVIVYELLKESDFHLLSYGESNYQIIFAFGWVQDLQTVNDKCFTYLIHDFITAVKLFGNNFMMYDSI